MPKSILIADDDPHIREVLAFALEKAGLSARAVEDGEAALAAVAHSPPDLIILDINMPKMDGLEVCRRLRAESDIPILFLSSRDDEIDRVLGIELGADDYVVKPFSPREVVARVTAILRRSGAKSAAVQPAGQILEHGRLRLDLDGWRARWGEEEVVLTVTEFGMLRALTSAPGRVLTRDMIIDRIHGPGFAITDRTIDSHIRNLRAKFAKLGCTNLIETRAGLGYSIGACAADDRQFKNLLKRHWPRLRLRTILLGVLLFVRPCRGSARSCCASMKIRWSGRPRLNWSRRVRLWLQPRAVAFQRPAHVLSPKATIARQAITKMRLTAITSPNPLARPEPRYHPTRAARACCG